MANKKIDNLFQEQLKNLEVSPNKRVWNNIEGQLKKNKRNVFPFWWFTGSVASILVLTLLISPFSVDENQNIKNKSDEIITTIPNKETIITTKINTLTKNKNIKDQIVITKKEDVLKTPKMKVDFSKPSKKEERFKTEKNIKSIQLNHHPIVINSNFFLQKKLLSTIKHNGTEKSDQKLNIQAFTKKEEKTPLQKPNKSWSVAPVFAILTSNSLTDTSPINKNLAKSTSGENSYAYGVQVAFKLNNKWSIQSGVYRQEMNYTNNQISVNSSSQINPYATKFSNGDSFSFSNTIVNERVMLNSSNLTANTINSNGNVAQNMGYIEIPVEVKYNFSNHKRFSSQIVTGFSTLFLNKNEVVLSTQTFSTNLEATNLNNINFSGNLGFDFNYFLNTKWSFHINPMFKVHLNTFNDNANGFAPFNLGLYTGIKYQL